MYLQLTPMTHRFKHTSTIALRVDTGTSTEGVLFLDAHTRTHART